MTWAEINRYTYLVVVGLANIYWGFSGFRRSKPRNYWWLVLLVFGWYLLLTGMANILVPESLASFLNWLFSAP